MEQLLYIVRHAHATSSAPDKQRPLSDKGHRQVDRLVRGLLDRDLLRPSNIWHSGLVRSIETATGLAKGLALEATFTQKPGLAPYDDPQPVAAQVNESSQNLLIVGHEPNLSALASVLLTGTLGNEYLLFGKATVLCLARIKIAAQSTPWQIHWHISHKHFK